jgi:NAD-dependent deacetylase
MSQDRSDHTSPELEARRAFISSLKQSERLLVVTGAGISVASGISPFRKSEDAHWERDVTELATNRYFQTSPEGSWRWYLSRFANLAQVQPNPAHHALRALGELLEADGQQMTIITQNIDGLHRAAGSETIEVHGRADMLRCVEEGDCHNAAPRGLVPRSSVSFERFEETGAKGDLPTCSACGALLRPHVLWFDESYNEHEAYGIDHAIQAATEADLVLFIGTSFSVGITYFIEQLALQRRAPMWAIDPSPIEEESPPGTLWLREPSELALPALVELYQRA